MTDDELRLENREALIDTLTACPADHAVDLQLFDGSTLIHAIPVGERVVITISDAMGLHLSMTHQMARRLSVDLAWAGMQAGLAEHQRTEAEGKVTPK